MAGGYYPAPSAPPAVSFPTTAGGVTYAQIPYRCMVCGAGCGTAYTFPCGAVHAVHLPCYNQEYQRILRAYAGTAECILCKRDRPVSPYGFIGGVVIGQLPVIPETVAVPASAHRHTTVQVRYPENTHAQPQQVYQEAALYVHNSRFNKNVCICIIILFIVVGIILSVWFWLSQRN